MTTPFAAGDRVRVLPHAGRNEDGSVRHDLATVTNPADPTDMRRLDGSPVGFYVRVDRDAGPKNQGYHPSSLVGVGRA